MIRTRVSRIEHNEYANKYGIWFDVMKIHKDIEYVISEVCSSPVFDTPEEAFAAAARAEAMFNKVGNWPNLRDKF